MTEEKLSMVITVNNQEIKLNPSIINQFIQKGNEKISHQEAINFMQLCKYAELNPFLNEAYLIKFSGQPAQMVVSKEAFMKRANRQPQYNGFKAGIVVQRGDEIVKKTGQALYPNEKLLGGWAEVYRKDIDYPVEVEVSLIEFSKGQSTWKSMPANMIRKVALVNALREAFPEALGAMYTEDEPNVGAMKNVTPQPSEKTAELLSDFEAIEVENIREAEEVDTDVREFIEA